MYTTRCGKGHDTERAGKMHEQDCDDCKHVENPEHPPKLSELDRMILADIGEVCKHLHKTVDCEISLDGDEPLHFLLQSKFDGGILRCELEVEVDCIKMQVGVSVDMAGSPIATREILVPSRVSCFEINALELWRDGQETIRIERPFLVTSVYAIDKIGDAFVLFYEYVGRFLLDEHKAVTILSDPRYLIRTVRE